MTKKNFLVFGLCLLLTGAMAMAQAPRPPREGVGPGGQGGPGGPAARRGGGDLGNFLSPLVARLLELTEDQRAAIRTVMEESREAAKPIREQLRDLRQQAADAVKNDAPEATFDSLGDQMGVLEGDLTAIGLKTRSTIYNDILTAEQRAKLEEIRNEMQNRRQNRRENRPGAGGPPAAPAPAPQG